MDLFRKATPSRNTFTMRFEVKSVETAPFQRHPIGGLQKWEAEGGPVRGTQPPREDLFLTLAHLEPVYAHGEVTTCPSESMDLHAMGGLDVRSVHSRASDVFKLGQQFLLSLEEI